MKKIFIILAIPLLAASCQTKPAPAPSVSQVMDNPYTQNLKVGGQTLKVEIVSTPEKLEKGLSGRDKFSENEGMLFDFGSRRLRPDFWMKDMKFDLDLIWVLDGKIIGITPNVPHPTSSSSPLPMYPAPGIVNQVLEVNAGWSEQNKIKIGDELRF